MQDDSEKKTMIELYVHETNQLIEQLESIIIASEESGTISLAINEIFRVMHTIKGNSMMMQYNGIANIAHALEDMFDFMRTEKPENVKYNQVTDLVLEAVDYIKLETDKISSGQTLCEDKHLIEKIKAQLESLKFFNDTESKAHLLKDIEEPNEKYYYYQCTLSYENDCEMVNVRAYLVVNQLSEITVEQHSCPSDLNDDKSISDIKKDGLQLAFVSSQRYEEVLSFFNRFSYIENIYINKVQESDYDKIVSNINNPMIQTITQRKKVANIQEKTIKETTEKNNLKAGEQKYISVKVSKLDQLMNLVTELVVAEAMVTRNPELENLKLDNFKKSAKHMKNIMNDLQDVVMEIRMVPLSLTFQKMKRLARDMSRQTQKDVELELIGQETEVDKNIIEHLADPLMHLVRNAIDHGIEEKEIRENKGKNSVGKIILEAKQSGGEILIIVRDDGKGLDRKMILEKAEEKGLLYKPKEEYSDEETFQLIFQAGFSTKKEVTSFSGRGVGMDVVSTEIERINGSIQINSIEHKGTEITIRIPLTLAIIDCILVQVGKIKYAIPITSIKQMLRIKQEDIIKDPAGNEMIMMRKHCLKIIRMNEIHHIKAALTDITKGMIVYIENNDKGVCAFVDKLIGEYQLVVKSFSKYLEKVQGIAGCALLADGEICLIIDPLSLIGN